MQTSGLYKLYSRRLPSPSSVPDKSFCGDSLPVSLYTVKLLYRESKQIKELSAVSFWACSGVAGVRDGVRVSGKGRERERAGWPRTILLAHVACTTTEWAQSLVTEHESENGYNPTISITMVFIISMPDINVHVGLGNENQDVTTALCRCVHDQWNVHQAERMGDCSPPHLVSVEMSIMVQGVLVRAGIAVYTVWQLGDEL